MEVGKDEGKILDAAYRVNGPISDRIKNAPELLPGLQFYVDVFNTLTGSRQFYEGGIGRIPYSELSQYCRDYNITGEFRDRLLQILELMDCAYVDWQIAYTRKKMDADMKASRAKVRAKR